MFQITKPVKAHSAWPSAASCRLTTRFPPFASVITTMTDTNHLAAAALCGNLNNRGVEHGPLGISVLSLPQTVGDVLPKV